jgi:hypothetical protein
MTNSRYVGLRLPPDLWRAVHSAVSASGQSQAEWLRAALGAAVDRQSVLHSIEELLVASERRLSAAFRADLDAALGSIEIVDPSPSPPRR